MNRLSIPAAVWLGFAISFAHNLEELFAMRPFLAAHHEQLPAMLQAMTGGDFAFSLVTVTVLFFVVAWLAAHSEPRERWLTLFIGLQPVLALNGLQHAAMAVWNGGYAPGAATGLLLLLPCGVFLIRHALRQGWARGKPVAIVAVVAAISIYPLLLGLHALAMAIG